MAAEKSCCQHFFNALFIVFLLSSVFRVLQVVISQSINNRKPSFPPEGVVLSSPDFTSALIRLLYIIYEPFLCRELLGSQSARADLEM